MAILGHLPAQPGAPAAASGGLAGLAVHLCRQASLETTPAFPRTPSCMRARGVIVNAGELESL